ncbi:MAG TPA: LuxR C-terminal-related transcriptional regulator [Flavobacteriales bacterium]
MEVGRAQGRRSSWWSVVLYGTALAALILLLKYVEYHYLLRDLRVEVYIGVVAVLFTALGIWMGTKYLEGRRQVEMVTIPVEAPVRVEAVDREEAVRRSGVSGRELEVLELMAEGRSNQEIADRLFISLPTVKSHSSNLFTKLDVKRRTEAVHKAKSLGLIP